MIASKKLLVIILSFVLGVFFYLLGAVLVVGHEPLGVSIDPFSLTAVVFAGGMGAVALGYGSVVVLGGKVSLGLVEFVSHFTRSRHVIEIVGEEPQLSTKRLTRDILVYLPVLVFLLSLSLAWDVYNLHDPRASIFHAPLHTLDIFSKSITPDSVSYSLSVVPVMLVLVAIAGAVPSMVLPYFRRFKITGVNSGPFHTDLLFMVLGVIVGLGTLLTLVGQVYRVLWFGKGPYYYHYILPAMFGLSLHYVLGSFLGRGRSEDMVRAALEAGSGKRVIRDTLSILGTRGDEKQSLRIAPAMNH